MLTLCGQRRTLRLMVARNVMIISTTIPVDGAAIAEVNDALILGEDE